MCVKWRKREVFFAADSDIICWQAAKRRGAGYTIKTA